MENKVKSILVTGGAGYIGSHTIVELVNGGYDVVSIDNFSNSSSGVFDRLKLLTGKTINNYDIDLCDKEKVLNTFSGKKFDAIIHFAAYKAVGDSVKDPLRYYDNNISSLLNILSLAKICEASQFIFSSSAAVYDPKVNSPYNEESPLAPASPYGMTKLICEMLIRDYVSHTPSLQAISLRYFNPAGAHSSLLIGENPNGKPNNLVPIMTRAAINKESVTIFGNIYGTPDGTCIRDYVHVVDVAKAHVAALKMLESKPEVKYDVFNLGMGAGVSVMQMINSFKSVTGVDVPYIIGDKRPGDSPEMCANINKASTMLGWSSKNTLEDMLDSAWQWEKKLASEKDLV